MDKLPNDAIQIISGTGLLGGIFYWINVRWRFGTIRDDLKEIKAILNKTRSVETCNIMNHNITSRLDSIEEIQSEVRRDIKQLIKTAMFKI